jgi:rhodanese-related sulfurtransferase
MTQTSELATSRTVPKLVDAPTLKRWLDSAEATAGDRPSLLLIDVREPVEYANEHIPGAISQPLSQLDPNQIHLQPEQPLVVYCQSGKRSARAVEQLNAAGLTDIMQLQCGITAWKAEAYPLEKIQDAPISLFRQVQIVAGLLVLVGTILGAMVSPAYLLLSGFVGAGLIFAGLTNTCAMAMLLAKLPYNQRAGQRWQS